jgi:hypothetical protein
MAVKDDLDNGFRAATREIRGAPVQWSEVDQRARRHKRAAFRGYALLALAITVLTAAVSVAVKVAVDPAYRAQLSSASTAISFGEATADLGHTELGTYVHEAGAKAPSVSAMALREQGFVFRAKLRLTGLRARELSLTWTLRSATSGKRARTTTYGNPTMLRPASNKSTPTVQVWISYPHATGRYRVALTVRDARGRTLNVSQSRPFIVTAPRIATAYQAPSYGALVPSGWKLVEGYNPAPLGRFVTKMVGPSGLSLFIDTKPHYTGNPELSAKSLEAKDHGNPVYRRVSFHSVRSVGGGAFEWSFEFEGRRRTDIFLSHGDDGYAVLAIGPTRHAGEILAVAMAVSRSIVSRTP